MSTSTAVGYDPMAPARTTGTSITVDALAFKQAITTVKPAVMKNPEVPAMGALLLQVSDYQGYLTATCLELELTVAIETTDVTPGRMLVPIAPITAFLKHVAAKTTGPLTLTADAPGSIIARLGRLTTVISTPPVEDFPATGFQCDEENGTVIAAAEIADVFGATSDNELRPALTGVYFHDGNVLAATDSYHLNITTGTFRLPEGVAMVLPPLALAQVIRHGGTGSLRWNDRRACFRMGNLTVICDIIDAEFPNYANIYNSQRPAFTLRVKRAEILAVIKELTPFTDVATGLRFEIGDDLTINMVAISAAMSSSVVAKLEAEIVEGRGFQPGQYAAGLVAAFNPIYLADVLGGALADPEATIDLSFTDGLKPWLISETTGAYLRRRLIMPVRIT